MQHEEGCHDTDNARSGSGDHQDQGRDPRVVEQAALAAHVPGRPGVVGGHGGGDLRHQQRQPGPDHHPARQLPGPGRLRHLRLRPRRPGRHRPAHLHRLRLRRGAGRARRLGAGGRVPAAAVRAGLSRSRADRGGGQAGRAVAGCPAAAPLHHARRDRARRGGRPRLRRLRERRLCLQRPVHRRRPVAAQPGRDRGAARHPGPGRARAVDGHPRGDAVRRRRPPWPAAAQPRRPGVLSAGGAAAWAVGCLPGHRGVAHPAADRHPGAVAGDPARPRAGRDPGPGAPVHHPELGAAGPGRAPGGADPATPLAPGATDRRTGRTARRPRLLLAVAGLVAALVLAGCSTTTASARRRRHRRWT